PGKIGSYDRHQAIISNTPVPPSTEDEAIREVLTLLRLRTGHDFNTYKRSTVLRRIERRVAVHELTDVGAYAAWLRDHPDEARALLKDLLISVTAFFRDPAAFEVLARQVIPFLFANKGANDHVRVWVPGCATGEEVYTLAMLLCESLPDLANSPTIQVFATDIDEWALGKARAGFYSTSDVAALSPERLRRFFSAERDGYRVRPELRELVLFAMHNVVKHPPYAHLDLISCRNLLIYINRAAQNRIVEMFHFGLNPEGFLFLGTSESLDGAEELFSCVNNDAHIFRSRAAPRRRPFAFADVSFAAPPAIRQAGRRTGPAPESESLSPQTLHQRLLEQYAPPSLVVNADNELVYVSDAATRYTQIRGGEPTKHILDLVRPELAPELRALLWESARAGTRLRTDAIEVSLDGVSEEVSLVVCPAAAEDDRSRGYRLVIIEKVNTFGEAPDDAARTSPTSDAIVRDLEAQLRHAKWQFSATLEQHELQQEEFKAANEELQSMNEELHSASEELETSKEELQSYNEELSTVNQELKVKIEELTVANNDMWNLINSTEIATLFLDRAYGVKRFTPRAREIFSLVATDVGRSLLDITCRVSYEELIVDVDAVLDRLQPIERQVQSQTGQWYIAKLSPYRTVDDRIDGVVLTFTDITHYKEAEQALRSSEEQFRRAIQEAPIPVI
ncbi:MAG TPA: CheR family methyltransferase, partial [Longimicrobiales bacterium]|nr:CheR family methyltransferase [Longimicrobiales bacterium]